MPRSLAALWAVLVAALVAFLAFGSVRVGAGNWIGARMPIRQVWARFTEYLVDQGASSVLVLGVAAAALVALAGAAVLLWLAFALGDAPDDPGER